MEINFPSDYVMWTETTAIYPRTNINQAKDYESLGLISECGEVAGMLKRKLRDGKEIDRMNFMLELGDIAWYLARLHYDHTNDKKEGDKYEFVEEVQEAMGQTIADNRTCLGAVLSSFRLFRTPLREFIKKADSAVDKALEAEIPIIALIQDAMGVKLTSQEKFLGRFIRPYSCPDGMLLNLIIDKCYEVDGILYFCFFCDRFNFDIMEVLQNNVYKLESRRDRGTLSGAGDHR
jgi:hypothetical protein